MWSVRTVPCRVLTVVRKQVALHALTADFRPYASRASGDLVHFVEEHDPGLLGSIDGRARDLLHVEKLLFLLLGEHLQSLEDRHLASLPLSAEDPGKHFLDVDVHFLDALVGDDLDRIDPALDLDLDHPVVEVAVSQPLAQLLARPPRRVVPPAILVGLRRHQDLQHPVLGVLLGAERDVLHLFRAHHFDRHLD